MDGCFQVWAGLSGRTVPDKLIALVVAVVFSVWDGYPYTGVWGALPSNVDYNDDGHCSSALGCLFADFGGGLHNLRFESADGTLPPSDDAALHSQLRRFKSFRVGDADAVEGERTDVG